jgi:glycosyltransferase involved in cell wall biosynthesis
MITLAIPNFNRTDLLFECFKDVIDDDRISEIVIVDDHSEMECFNAVAEYCSHIPKVRLYRNEKNLDCYRNKREAVSKATNEWVILFDSDNIITKAYLDCLLKPRHVVLECFRHDIIAQPSFAKPHFDFRGLDGMIITKENVSSLLGVGSCQTMLNAMNYFVSRDEYLRVWDGSVDPVTSDSIFQAYNWLKNGNSIYVVPGLEYEHRVHPGSHYQNNHRRTPRGFHESIIQKLKEMK